MCRNDVSWQCIPGVWSRIRKIQRSDALADDHGNISAAPFTRSQLQRTDSDRRSFVHAATLIDANK